MYKDHKTKQAFTILELLIATTVFSVVLLVCMVGVTRMGRLYYKGLTMSQTQETARRLSDEVVSQIQFGNGDIEPTPIPTTALNGGQSAIFCIGEYRYKVVYNRPLNASNPEVFVREPKVGTTCETNEATSPFGASKSELVNNNIRVSRFSVRNTAGNLWEVDIMLTFGDEDLLLYPTGPGADDSPSKFQNVVCRSGVSGSEFCATSQLTTTVLRRL